MNYILEFLRWHWPLVLALVITGALSWWVSWWWMIGVVVSALAILVVGVEEYWMGKIALVPTGREYTNYD